jgi:hypothetical protein
LKTLAKKPDQRYENARVLIDALERLERVAHADSKLGNKINSSTLRTGLMILGTALITGLAVFSALTFWPRKETVPSPSPEATLLPTETPNANPGVTSHLLEERFDNQQLDDSYNDLLWFCNDCSAERASQSDGFFRIRMEPSAIASGRDIETHQTWTASELAYIQADLRLVNFDGSRHADVHAQLWADFPDYDWWTSCDVFVEPDAPSRGYFSCHVARIYPDGTVIGQYSSSPVVANLVAWHVARIEVEPETFKLRYFLNDKLVGSTVPADADLLKSTPLKPSFGVWTEGMSSFTAYLDNIIIAAR